MLYPDDVQGLALNFDPGLNIVALINSYGDISTIHSDGFSDPVLVSLAGLPCFTRDVALLPRGHSDRSG